MGIYKWPGGVDDDASPITEAHVAYDSGKQLRAVFFQNDAVFKKEAAAVEENPEAESPLVKLKQTWLRKVLRVLSQQSENMTYYNSK